MQVSWLQPDDALWQNFLSHTPHDVYHLPAYVTLNIDDPNQTAFAFYAEHAGCACLVPLVRRPLPAPLLNGYNGGDPGNHDLLSPYGYAAPLFSPGTPDDVAAAFMAALKAATCEVGCVSLFARLHPLLGFPEAVFAKHGDLVQRGETVYVDLEDSDDLLWRHTRNNHRRHINKLKREGYTVRMNDWSQYDDFVAIYRATMQRLDARDFYFFSEAYFDGWRSDLGAVLHLCTVTAPDGRVAAAGLFPAVGDIIQFHLSGTHDDFRKQAPSKLMLHGVRAWGKAQGYRYFHLGGGLGGRADSLFEFKSGFSNLSAPFYTYHMILDANRYHELVALRDAHCGDAADDAEFFPLYRKLC